jgi:membrane protein
VGVLHRLWEGQKTGQALSDEQLLQEVVGLEQSRWDEYSQMLLQEDIIRRTDQGEFLLSRGLGSLTLNELCRRLPWPIPDPLEPTDSEKSWQKNLDQHLSEVKNLQNHELSITLERLFGDADK